MGSKKKKDDDSLLTLHKIFMSALVDLPTPTPAATNPKPAQPKKKKRRKKKMTVDENWWSKIPSMEAVISNDVSYGDFVLITGGYKIYHELPLGTICTFQEAILDPVEGMIKLRVMVCIENEYEPAITNNHYLIKPEDLYLVSFSDWWAAKVAYLKLKRSLADQGKSMFETVILPQKHKDAILEACAQMQPDIRTKIFTEWQFSKVFEKGTAITMLFYGPPGTGKTLTAQAIAEMLNTKLMVIGSAEIQSMEPGGAERAMKKIFLEASKSKAVLLLDECDSLIYHRQAVGMIMAAEINCLLGEIEKYDGILILTTNNTPVLDKALERRIMLKLEFPKPTQDLRVKIWERMFARHDILEGITFQELAKLELSGGQIKNIVLNAARKAAYEKKEKIHAEDLKIACERELAASDEFTNIDDEDHLIRQRGISGGGVMGIQGGSKTKSIERGMDIDMGGTNHG